MSPRKPRNVIAVTPGGDLTLDHILGWYAVSSIPDAGVSASKLRRAWIQAGMEPNLVPKNRKAVHAFQVACRSVETRRSDTSTSNGRLKQVGRGGEVDALKQVEVRVDESWRTRTSASTRSPTWSATRTTRSSNTRRRCA